MPTTSRGRFFLAKRDAVTTDVTAQGDFRLTLRVFDRIGTHKVEPYVVKWAGSEAAAWWQENRAIAPGAVLDLELVNPRAMPGRISPEIHATVTRCTHATVPNPPEAHDAARHHAAPTA